MVIQMASCHGKHASPKIIHGWTFMNAFKRKREGVTKIKKKN